jgi:hypothetical protein
MERKAIWSALLIAIVVLSAGCSSKEKIKYNPEKSASISDSNWNSLNTAHGVNYTTLTAHNISSNDYTGIDVNFSGGFYEIINAGNNTVYIKGMIASSDLPAAVRSSDHKTVVWLYPVQVTGNPQEFENTFFSGSVDLNDSRGITFSAALVNKSGGIMTGWSEMQGNKKNNSFKFYHPVKNIGEIAGWNST